MMLVQYLIDRDVEVEIPGTDPVRNTFDSPTEALRLALDQERAVTEQISRLAARRPRRGRLPRRAVHAVVPQGAGRGGRADHHAGPGRASAPAPTCSTSRTSWPARSARPPPMPPRRRPRAAASSRPAGRGPLRSARSAASPWYARDGWWRPTRRRRPGSTARPRSGRRSSSTARGRARRPGRPAPGARAASRSTDPPRWRRRWWRRCRPRYRDVSPSSTVGSIGAARRIRQTAAAENDITTARDRSADAGDGDAVAVQQGQHLALHQRAVAHRVLGLDEDLDRPVPVEHQRDEVVEGQQAGVALAAVRAANSRARRRNPVRATAPASSR